MSMENVFNIHMHDIVVQNKNKLPQKSEGQIGKRQFDKSGKFQVHKPVKWGVILDSILSMGVTNYLKSSLGL